MNENLGSWLNPLSGTLGSGAAYTYTESADASTGNLVTDDGTLFVTDDGTEIIYSQ